MCEGKFLVRTKVLDNVIRQVTVENFRFGVCVSKKPEGGWISQDLNNFYSKKKKKELKRVLLLELQKQQEEEPHNNTNNSDINVFFSSDNDCDINSIKNKSTSFIQNPTTAPKYSTTATSTTAPLLENSREANELQRLDVVHKGTSLSLSSSSASLSFPLSRPLVELHEEKEKCDIEQERKKRKDREKVEESSNNKSTTNNTTSSSSKSKEEKSEIELWDANNEKHVAILNDFFHRDYKKFSNKEEHKSVPSSLPLSSSSPITTTSHSTTNSILYKHLKNKSINKNIINKDNNTSRFHHYTKNERTLIHEKNYNHNNNNHNNNNHQYIRSLSSSTSSTVYKNNRNVPLLLSGNFYGKLIREQQQYQQKKSTPNVIPNCSNDNGHIRNLTTIHNRNPICRNQVSKSDIHNRDISQYFSQFFGKSPLLKLQLLNLLVVPTPNNNNNNTSEQEQVQWRPSSRTTTTCAPDLIHISRLKNMLFDSDDGNEKSGEVSIVNMPGEQQPRIINNNNNSNSSSRLNDIEFEDDEDPLIEAKRVKMENLDDDDDLVIDENALDGHQSLKQQEQQDVEMSESSNDCNLETSSSLFSITEVTSNATTNDLLDNRNINNNDNNNTSKNNSNTVGPSSITEVNRRPSSASSQTSSSSLPSQQQQQEKKTQNLTNSNNDLIDKNGHDTNVSQNVPKNTVNSTNQNMKYNNNNNTSNKLDECNNNNAASSSSSSLSSNNSADSNIPSTTTTTNNSIENKVLQLEKEILSLTTLLKIKEKEWNAIIRLKKLKELTLEIYRRQKDVYDLKEFESNPQFEDFTSLLAKINSEREKIGLGENETRLNLEKTEKDIKEEEKRLKDFYNNDVDTDESATTTTTGNSTTNTINKGSITTKQTNDSPSTTTSSTSTEQFKASLALQQLCERNRSSSINQTTNHITSTNLLQNKVIGEGRQGTIVEVKSIIAHHHRSKNSDDTSQENKPKKPRRATSSSSSANNNNSNAIVSSLPQNPDIKYMDILVSIAQSHNETHGKSVANIATPFENITTNARSITKSNSNILNNSSSSTSSSIQMQHINAFNSSPSGSSTSTSRQLGTTLAKLLSSNSTVSVPGNISHMNEDSTIGTLSSMKRDSGNHSERDNNSLSLASLLASSAKKGREEELKQDDDDLAPVCQGCGTSRAQFVCAGCANQWYCSRECQVSAWDEHSEICSG